MQKPWHFFFPSSIHSPLSLRHSGSSALPALSPPLPHPLILLLYIDIVFFLLMSSTAALQTLRTDAGLLQAGILLSNAVGDVSSLYDFFGRGGGFVLFKLPGLFGAVFYPNLATGVFDNIQGLSQRAHRKAAWRVAEGCQPQ